MLQILNTTSAIQILKSGGVIAYPTETFYGLGCDATNPVAVQKLFDIKGRASNVPIPVLIGDLHQLSHYVQEIPAIAKKLIEKFWPGPLTLIFKAKEVFSSELLAGTGKIAIRISSHPLALQLVKNFGLPLTTTSANRSGDSPSSRLEQIEKYFGDKIDGVIDGKDLFSSLSSTILDVTVTPPKLVREGAISVQQFQDLII